MNKRQQSGQGMTEYIIIVGLIAVALIVVVAYFGQRSKATLAKSATALAGRETTGAAAAGASGKDRSPNPQAGGTAGPAGSSGSARSSTAGAGGGDSAAGPGIVSSGGGGTLAADFKRPATATTPASYTPEDDSPWKVVEIPEEDDAEALAAFAGKVDRRASGGDRQGGGGGVTVGFPLGTVALILMVAAGGGFVMVYLMKRT